MRALEELQTSRLHQLMRYDPRWVEADFRTHCEEMDHRLREEARTFEQMRQATRQLIALTWEEAGDPERAKAVMRGGGNLCEELRAVTAALDGDVVRWLGAALRSLQTVREGDPTEFDARDVRQECDAANGDVAADPSAPRTH